MDMSAHFLPGLRGSKDSNDGNFRQDIWLRRSLGPRQLRIEIRWGSLVVVNAVEPNPEKIHLRSKRGELAEHTKSERMM